MSRSRIKTPIHKIACCYSEKKDKKIANRKWRRNEKQALSKCESYEEYMTIHKQENSNVWNFSGDGKIYWPDMMDPDYIGHNRFGRWVEADPFYKRIMK